MLKFINLTTPNNDVEIRLILPATYAYAECETERCPKPNGTQDTTQKYWQFHSPDASASRPETGEEACSQPLDGSSCHSP